MKNNVAIWILIIIIMIVLSLFSMVMHEASKRICTLEEEVSILQEDLEIHKAVFASYLNGTLSNDGGGE